MVKEVLIKAVRVYQFLLSPWFGGHCRFYPSCSEYAARAFEKFPLWKTLFYSVKRVLKCHPFHPGGVDFPC